MKPATQLCFHSVISNEIADFEKYQDIAMKIVKLLNNDLGEQYPEAFYYLKAKIKGGYKYYAGSVADPGQWDDPKFKEILNPIDASGEHEKSSRRKGN